MKKLGSRAIVVAMLVASSVSVSAASPKPPKPPKPAPPTVPAPPANPTPGGDFVKCMADGNSVQICMAGYPG